MGCAASSVESEATGRSKLTDDKLQNQKSQEHKVVKILLLGCGQSGKSTLLKQIRIIHQDGYSEQERKKYLPIVYSNTIKSLNDIISSMGKLHIDFADPTRKDDAVCFGVMTKQTNEVELTPEVGELMDRLWRDAGVQLSFSRSREYQLNDSAAYYLNDLSRISHAHYVPTEQDVLHTWVRTIGISTTKFKSQGLLFRVFDMGGDKSQRKKWIHCFEGIILIVAIQSDLFCENIMNIWAINLCNYLSSTLVVSQEWRASYSAWLCLATTYY